MELPKENLDTLQKSIRYSLQDKTLELEAVVNKDISQAKFIQILQKIKKMKHHVAPEVSELETLDISFADRAITNSFSSVRFFKTSFISLSAGRSNSS